VEISEANYELVPMPVGFLMEKTILNKNNQFAMKTLYHEGSVRSDFTITNIYSNGVSDIFAESSILLSNFDRVWDIINFYSNHTYCIGISFDSNLRRQVISSEVPHYCMSKIKVYYMRLCREILGDDWKRKIAYQPLMYYCLDDEGSKFSRVNFYKTENIHFHGLIQIHPDYIDRWNLLNLNRIKKADLLMDNVWSQNFNPNMVDINDPERKFGCRWINYSSKAIQFATDSNCYWDFLPKKPEKRIEALERTIEREKADELGLGMLPGEVDSRTSNTHFQA
jgi:hypothetical protein